MPAPAVPVDIQAHPWGLDPSDDHGFNRIGFSPEGWVYFQYGATSNGGSALTIAARSDLDGDGTHDPWGYVKPKALISSHS